MFEILHDSGGGRRCEEGGLIKICIQAMWTKLKSDCIGQRDVLYPSVRISWSWSYMLIAEQSGYVWDLIHVKETNGSGRLQAAWLIHEKRGAGAARRLIRGRCWIPTPFSPRLRHLHPLPSMFFQKPGLLYWKGRFGLWWRRVVQFSI